jgi:ABC-type multidrug transport system fused ATPase/permease subunit
LGLSHEDVRFSVFTYVLRALALSASSGLRVYLATTLGNEVGSRLRIAFYSSLIAQPLDYFDRNPTGNLVSVAIADVTVIQTALRSSISPLTPSFHDRFNAGINGSTHLSEDRRTGFQGMAGRAGTATDGLACAEVPPNLRGSTPICPGHRRVWQR